MDEWIEWIDTEMDRWMGRMEAGRGPPAEEAVREREGEASKQVMTDRRAKCCDGGARKTGWRGSKRRGRLNLKLAPWRRWPGNQTGAG